MATISVNPLNFTYKQYVVDPAGIVVTFSVLTNNVVSFGNVPNWLQVAPIIIIDSTTVSAEFFINTNNANTLTEGEYNAAIDVFTEIDNNGAISYRNEGVLNVNLTFTESIDLSVTPENVVFNYTSGAANPTGKIIQVFSENSWTLTSSNAWLTTSIASGANNGNFTINVDPSGLTDANNLGTITVDDGASTQIIQVSLLISDGNTAQDFLYLAPTEVEFIKNIGSSFNPAKTLSLNSSESWTAVSSASWLVLSVSSGSSGTDVIEISLDDTGLNAGNYTADLTVTAGTMIRKTYVSLHLTEATVSIPDNGGLYFSEDDVSIVMNSENENAVLEVDFILTTAKKSASYTKSAPYIKSEAIVNVGEECINFITPLDFQVPITSKITTLLHTAVLSFSAYEKNYFTSNVVADVYRNNLNFLNGKTPTTENKLTYLPAEITISKKGVIAMHLYKTIAPANIVISGAITKTISVSDASDSNIYSAFINLGDYNLSPLDVIVINFDDISVTARIREEQAESVLLSFENEWQLPEIIELTGGLEIENNTNFATQEIKVDNGIQEQIYKTNPTESFSIYTGFIESEEEIAWLSKIRNSKKIHLILNNEKTEVIPTFKGLPVYKTRQHQKNFRLTFKKAIV